MSPGRHVKIGVGAQNLADAATRAAAAWTTSRPPIRWRLISASATNTAWSKGMHRYVDATVCACSSRALSANPHASGERPSLHHFGAGRADRCAHRPGAVRQDVHGAVRRVRTGYTRVHQQRTSRHWTNLKPAAPPCRTSLTASPVGRSSRAFRAPVGEPPESSSRSIRISHSCPTPVSPPVRLQPPTCGTDP